MKTDLNSIKDWFKIGYEAFEDSRDEAQDIIDLYHNRQFTSDELAILENRGQPPETFNIVKLFARILVGYYSTVVNTVKITPRQESDQLVAMLLQDTVQYVFEDNNFETESEKIKLDAMLTGIMACYMSIEPTGEKDEFGRDINRIDITYVPSREIVLDPMSKKEDYSDARFQHRFKWVSEDSIRAILRSMGKSKKKIDDIVDRLNEYENHVHQEDTEFTAFYNDRFVGENKQYNNYLLIHTVIQDDEGDMWSVYWCGDEELSRKKVTYREVRFPYRIQRLQPSSDRAEYYGIFREVQHSQRAINQAIIKIQISVNSNKAIVEGAAVDNIDEFKDAYNSVSGVIEVKSIDKIKIENLAPNIQQQYMIIDKALERAQRILGVTPSFLGEAFASDSGRKVKLQANATTMALRTITVSMEQFYRLVGMDVCNLVKQFYTAHQVLRIADEPTGVRWVEINKPLQIWTGEVDPDTGQPIMETPFEEVTDPESGEPLLDEEGNYIMAPIPEEETEIAFRKVDISIDSVPYNDEDEKNQLMLENIIQGQAGQFLQQANPAAYAKVFGLMLKSVHTKHSHEIADIFEMVGASLSPEQQAYLSEAAIGGPGKGQNSTHARLSQALKLPTNTNEGVDG